MNRTLRHTIWVIALAALMTVTLIFAACGNKDKDPSETETGTGTGVAETSVQTAIPRYDYMEAEISPDVELDPSAYTGVTLTIPNKYRVEQEDVDAYVKNIRFQYRTAENGQTQVTDKALKLGDDAYIYYKGFVDGVAFDGGSNWDDKEPYQLGLGSGKFIDGFEDALVGVIPNTTSKENPIEIKVTFPEDYNEELGGKEATFQVAIMYSVCYVMADYTAEFVMNTLKYETEKEFYAGDAALLDEFEEMVWDKLEEQMDEEVEYAKIDAIWNHLTEQATCKNHPQTELDFYISSYTQEIEYYFEYYTSMGDEEFTTLYPNIDAFAIRYLGLAAGADWKAEVQKMSQNMVSKAMISHAIAEREGMESVTDEEVKNQIQYWISYYQGYMTESDIIRSMGMTFLRETAFSEKMETWLLSRFTFTYEDGTPLDGPVDTGTETTPETAVDSSALETTPETAADTAAES